MDNSSFSGDTDFTVADSILIWNNDDTMVNTNNYTTRWLLNGADPYKRWVKVGDNTLTAEDTNLIFPGDRASFVRRAADLTDFSYPAPWAR